MQVDYFYSDDYAGFESGKLHFYYGYEETDPEDENMWCFVVKNNGQVIFRLNEREIQKSLGKDSWRLNDVRDYLIAGVAIYKLLK